MKPLRFLMLLVFGCVLSACEDHATAQARRLAELEAKLKARTPAQIAFEACLSPIHAERTKAFLDLDRQEEQMMATSQSTAPVIIERRRLEERFCSAEAECTAQLVNKDRSLVYGESFAHCISEGKERY